MISLPAGNRRISTPCLSSCLGKILNPRFTSLLPPHPVPLTKGSIKSPLPLVAKEGIKNKFFAKEGTRMSLFQRGEIPPMETYV